MTTNKIIFLNKLDENPFIEIFRLEEIGDDTIFENYQRYDFYQVLWFKKVKGDSSYFLDFEEYTLEDNQIILIFPGQIDKLDTHGKEGFLYAIHNDIFFRISQFLHSGFLNGYTSTAILKPDKNTRKLLDNLNELILNEYYSQKRLPLLESYLQAFLFHISTLGDNTESNAVERKEPLIGELMKLIDTRFIYQRETEFYADSFGMSCKTINEICKKATGKTVKQHLQERLVLEIKKEIRIGKKSLKEIAFDLGFSEPAYFTRFFKQQTTLTPTQFRDS